MLAIVVLVVLVVLVVAAIVDTAALVGTVLNCGAAVLSLPEHAEIAVTNVSTSDAMTTDRPSTREE